MDEKKQKHLRGLSREHLGLILAGLGLFTFTLGAAPEFYGLDRSPVVGFVQITVFLLGLGMICVGGYLSLEALRNGRQRSLAADIGLRLVATGFVIAVISGMADVFGVGSQPWPEIPFFGPWQASGVILGQVMILVGFGLMLPSRKGRG